MWGGGGGGGAPVGDRGYTMTATSSQPPATTFLWPIFLFVPRVSRAAQAATR